MRIRKNAKLSSLLLAHSSSPGALQTHVCQLNQSPWDVIPFAPPTLHSLSVVSASSLQFEGDDSFTGNGSLGDSSGAVESSVASMMMVDADHMTATNNNDLEGGFNSIDEDYIIGNNEAKIGGDFSLRMCQGKSNGKGWQCKNEAREGHYLCEHHLSQSQTRDAKAGDDDEHDTIVDDSASRKIEKSSATGTRRAGRPRGAKKNNQSSSTANSNQFYYYSGFGPSWGRRRGERSGDQSRRKAELRGGDAPPSSLRIGGEDYADYEEEDEDEGDDDEEEDVAGGGGDSGKKRTRKPVKARSLKSLM